MVFYSGFWLLLFSSIACASEDKDLRVVNEAVSNRCGYSGGVEHFSPVCEGQVRCNQRGLCLVPCADDLEEEVRALWTEGEITEFVTNEEGRGLIIVELSEEGSVCLCGDEMIDHIDGRGEEDLNVGVACGIGDAFGQEGFAGPGVADEDHIPVLGDEVQVEEIEDLGFVVLS